MALRGTTKNDFSTNVRPRGLQRAQATILDTFDCDANFIKGLKLGVPNDLLLKKCPNNSLKDILKSLYNKYKIQPSEVCEVPSYSSFEAKNLIGKIDTLSDDDLKSYIMEFLTRSDLHNYADCISANTLTDCNDNTIRNYLTMDDKFSKYGNKLKVLGKRGIEVRNKCSNRTSTKSPKESIKKLIGDSIKDKDFDDFYNTLSVKLTDRGTHEQIDIIDSLKKKYNNYNELVKILDDNERSNDHIDSLIAESLRKNFDKEGSFSYGKDNDEVKEFVKDIGNENNYILALLLDYLVERGDINTRIQHNKTNDYDPYLAKARKYRYGTNYEREQLIKKLVEKLSK